MAALIKAVLSLHRRTLYPSPELDDAGAAASWDATPFYLVSRARAWFSPRSRSREAIIVYREDGGWAQLRFTEPGPDRDEVLVRGSLVAEGGCYLLPVAGASADAILARLAALRWELEEGVAPASVARRAAAAYMVDPNAPYALGLVGHDRDELLKEVAYATDGVRKAFAPGARSKAWQTPRGSAFTAEPLGGRPIAFVYPGAFNSYVGLGQDLFQHFPSLHAGFARLTADLGGRVAERWLYPRRRVQGGAGETEVWEARLRDHPIALIESGAMAAVAHSLLLRDVFGLQPHMALGYSLGEVSMLRAGGVWQDADRGSATFSASSLFRERVVGPKLAIREHWALPASEAMTWVSYLLKADVVKVREAIASEPRVYLTLINLDDEVVIGGEAAACSRVVAALDCHALEVPYDVAIHNEAMHSEYDRLAAVYTHKVFERPNVRFYSTSSYAPLVLEEAALAQAMATMSCHLVDFPRLVRQVYDDGARIFVELGPLATCTRRIKRILKGEPHAAVAINPSPGGDFEGVLGALALLVAHRAPVDLTALYEGEARIGRVDAREDVLLEPEPMTVLTVDTPDALAEGALPAEFFIRSGEWAAMHRTFLEAREGAQRGAGAVIGLQVAASGQLLGAPAAPASRLAAREGIAFTEADLRAFATGDVASCFGVDYERYRERRVPRIPNGDLQFMSRVIAIEGAPGVFQGEPGLWSEFDMPVRGWFDQGGAGSCRRTSR